VARKTEVKVRITGESRGAEAAAKRTESSFRKLSSFLASRFVVTLGDVTRAASAAMGAIRESLDLSAQTNVLKRQLADAGLSFDQFIEDAKGAANQTLSTAAIISNATRAKLLGVGFTEMLELLKIARVSAAATGDTVEKAFDDISLGLARQSKMILDNQGFLISLEKANENYAATLGKSAEALTDAERKTALLNQVLEQGRDRVEKFGDAASGLKEKLEQTEAGVDDLKTAVADLFKAFAEGATQTASARESLDSITESLKGQEETAIGMGAAFLSYLGHLKDTADPQAAFVLTLFDLRKIAKEAKQAMDDAGDSAEIMGGKLGDAGEESEELEGHFKNATEAAVGLGDALGEVTSVELELQIEKINEALEESADTLGENSNEYVRLEQIASEKIERLRARILNLRDGLGDLKESTEDGADAFETFSTGVNRASLATDGLTESTRRNIQVMRESEQQAQKTANAQNALGGESAFSQLKGGTFTTWRPGQVRQQLDGRLIVTTDIGGVV
jgi:methyl-accepting chemotaxis protein